MDATAPPFHPHGARNVVRFLEFCGETMPRPGQLLARRIETTLALSAVVVLSVLAATASDTLLNIDEPLSDWMRGKGSIEVWRNLSYPGATEVYVPITVVAAVVLWNRCRSLAITWPVLTVAAIVMNVVLKAAVDRPRPEDPITGVSLASYPSGHVIHATVVLGLIPPTIYIITRRPWTAWASALAGAALLLGAMLSRVALGAHWPTDVIAGFAVGIALLIVADLAVDLHAVRRTPQLTNLHPSRWPARTQA